MPPFQEVNGAPDILGGFGDAIGGILGIPPQGNNGFDPSPIPEGDFQQAPVTPEFANGVLAEFGFDPNDPFFQNLFSSGEVGAMGTMQFRSIVEGRATDLKNQGILDDLFASIEQGKADQRTGLDEFETNLQGQRDRLGRVLQPGGLESDAELANLLVQAERPLQGILRDSQASAASNLASGGLRRAGKATSGVRNAEIGVQRARGLIRGELLGNAETRLQGLDSELGRIPLQRGGIESGTFPDLLQSSAFGAGLNPQDLFGATTGTRFDIEAGQFGRDQAELGNFLDFGGLLSGSVDSNLATLLGAYDG